MATHHLFDATQWLRTNTHGGVSLSGEATEAVFSFTTMWNFFESAICENSANVNKFSEVVQSFQVAHVPPATRTRLNECLSFFKNRYVELNSLNYKFDRLEFRPKDRRELVEHVLLGRHATLPDEMLAMMIIVYRLRNNLFHGLKAIDQLNTQVTNLDNASKCMAALLEAIPSNLVKRV